MSLRRAASFGALQTVASMIVSFLSVKITSVYLGPVGVGTLGQMQYLISLTLGIVVAGLRNGVVRRTAELSDAPSSQAVVVGTVLRLSFLLGLPVAVITAALSGWLAEVVLQDGGMRLPIIVFSAAYLFGLVGTLMLGCANGAQDFRSTALINIIAGFANLGMFAVICPRFGVLGALIVVSVMPVVTWLIARAFATRNAWWPRRPLEPAFSRPEARRALAFIPAAAVSAIASPLVQLALRSDLAFHSGMGSVGLLQGITRLSDLYLGIVTSVLGMYFLPRFAEINRGAELTRELGRALTLIVPALALVSIALYLLREIIVRLLFTEAFLGMTDLFAWQMTGNVFRMVGWLFGYMMIAKAHPLFLAAYEAVAILIWWQLGVHLIATNGAVGATQAYAITYVIYSVMGVISLVFILRAMNKAPAEGPNPK